MSSREKASCGIGFVAGLKHYASHDLLQSALHALRAVEHRGACGADPLTSDGAGVMTDIPFELLGFEPYTAAAATLFLPQNTDHAAQAWDLFVDTFGFMDMDIIRRREIPTDPSVLGPQARESLPTMVQAVVSRPAHCTTAASFNTLLHVAKQTAQTRMRRKGLMPGVYFPSLSADTVVYKALVRGDALDRFYLDLQDPNYKTRFALFHRRFSTNTRTSWDKAQPFRVIAHNGEINTIAGNRSWAYSREKSLGLHAEELLTHAEISDSGSFNEMVEALMYRAGMSRLADVPAVMMPPADEENPFYVFWARAMEPWDGPACVVYSDGRTVGARLDRNGFRPARWALTDRCLYLCSEAGAFNLDDNRILRKGALGAGSGVNVDLATGTIDFEDPSRSPENRTASFDARLAPIRAQLPPPAPSSLDKKFLFEYTDEDLNKILVPQIATGKEPIGSMGDTARLAMLSDQPRSFFDFFHQGFAQVTNPPVDYLRERMVTDLSVFLGRRPNVFSPKDLIPPPPAFRLESPVLDLRLMEYLLELRNNTSGDRPSAFELDTTFDPSDGVAGFRRALDNLTRTTLTMAERGVPILILTDRHADFDRPAIPMLLAVRAVVNGLNESGLKLAASIVAHTGEVRDAHQLACLIGFGAAAVCPYLAFEIARWEPHPKLASLTPNRKADNLKSALESGLLKIMSKLGISVARSYQNAKLFTILGLGKELTREFFPGLESRLGGVEIEDVVRRVLERTEAARAAAASGKLVQTFQFREHARLNVGEKHAMTTARTRVVHRLVRETGPVSAGDELYKEYLAASETDEPVHVRHLFALKKAPRPLPVEDVQSRADIMRTFGTGGMSFGAVSAESQRDLIRAMRHFGGRSNSGEGGENPYSFSEGVAADVKQVASGRFGVTARYLITGREIQIKIAQGAKPGEGGQLMAAKVTDDIARARLSPPGVDLISPPPMHDIYSIEDLKELVHELKQFNPEAKISVKLVAGENIGTIAVGVAKAGADIVHVGGWDGGTGAAGLGSMKHAGLPWELGLNEAHRALVENGLRSSVVLRVDGGLHTGKDIVVAAILGAEEFDFGKLPLIAEGCIMARVCETNTCPAGIATHDPKFKAKYRGEAAHVVRLFEYLAEDVRERLAEAGVSALARLVGRTDLLEINPRHVELVERRKLDLSEFFEPVVTFIPEPRSNRATLGRLNERILTDARQYSANRSPESLRYRITTGDRAVLASLSGELARRDVFGKTASKPGSGALSVEFTGSAGQGFGVFLVDGIEARLFGEANDSVGKGMSGGKIVVTPRPGVRFDPRENTIIGNCALYGATGGKLFVNGLAGDRFAVRNSGATAVVEGVGLHACEYMTNGTVVILGPCSANLGAGMTGGRVFLYGERPANLVNSDYVAPMSLSLDEVGELGLLLEEYVAETGSTRAYQILSHWFSEQSNFLKYVNRSTGADRSAIQHPEEIPASPLSV